MMKQIRDVGMDQLKNKDDRSIEQIIKLLTSKVEVAQRIPISSHYPTPSESWNLIEIMKKENLRVTKPLDLIGELIDRKTLKIVFGGISSVTAWSWGKRGILSPVPIGGKIYYRKSDIGQLINKKLKK